MHETRKSLAERCIDLLIDYRWVLAGILLVATAVLAFFAGGVTQDPSMRSGIDTASGAYHQYQNFVDHFGNEEFILIVLNQGRKAIEPEALKSVQAITKGLEGLDKVTEVVSLTNLRVFKQRVGRFGVYPVVTMSDGHPGLPEEEEWNSLRNALPVMDFLVSKDLNTVGFLLRTEEANRFEIPAIETILNEASSIVQRNMLPGGQYRIVGPQVVRLACTQVQPADSVGFRHTLPGDSNRGFLVHIQDRESRGYDLCDCGHRGGVDTRLHVPKRDPVNINHGAVFWARASGKSGYDNPDCDPFQRTVSDRAESDGSNATGPWRGIGPVPDMLYDHSRRVRNHDGFFYTDGLSIRSNNVFGGDALFCCVSFVTTALLTSMRPIKPRSYERMASDFVAQMLARMKQRHIQSLSPRHSSRLSLHGGNGCQHPSG